MAKISKCQCGKRKSKYASRCNACEQKWATEQWDNFQALGGKCPQCGRPLKRNLAITHWWQCEQYGAEGFRKDSSAPACSFQVILPDVG